MNNIFKGIESELKTKGDWFFKIKIENIQDFLKNKGNLTELEENFIAFIDEVIRYKNNKSKLNDRKIITLFKNIFSELTEYDVINKILEGDKKLEKDSIEDGLILVIKDLENGKYKNNIDKCFKDFLSLLIELFQSYIVKIEFANKVAKRKAKTAEIKTKDKLDNFEKEIAKLVYEGKTNPQIAQELYRDRKKFQTVKNRLNIIYSKLFIDGDAKGKKEELKKYYEKYCLK